MRRTTKTGLALLVGAWAIAPLACGSSVTSGGAGAGQGGSGAGSMAASGGAPTTGSSTTTGGGAAGGGAPSGFTLVSAKMTSGTDVLLTFSEAVAPTTDVDPTQFRLSGVLETPPGTTFYCYDLGYCDMPRYNGCSQFAPNNPCNAPASASSYCCPPSATGGTHYYGVGNFVELLPGQQPNELVLRLDWGIVDDACSGLTLHYAKAQHGVESAGHEALADIGSSSWVAKPKQRFHRVNGQLPAKPAPVGIAILDKLCNHQACSDGLLDEYEGDVDCGQDCPKQCDVGQRCQHLTDCASMVCTNNICAAG